MTVRLDLNRIADVVAQAAARRAPMRARWQRLGLLSGRTLPQQFAHAAQHFGNARFRFWSEDRPAETTVAEVYAEALRIASTLTQLGFRRGDRVAMQLPQWSEWIGFFVGALEIGLIVVPVIHIYGANELGFVLRQTRARALVTPAQWRKTDYAERFRAMGELPDLEHVFVVGGDGGFPGPAMAWDELVERGTSAPPPVEAVPQDIATIFYTSGTTSTPKGVMHSHESLGARMIGTELRWRDARDRPMMGVMPAGHIAGMLSILRPFFTGEGLTTMDQWNADAAVDLVAEEAPYVATFAPMQLATLFDVAGDRPVSALRIVRTGGAGVPPSLILRADALGVAAGRTYGSTELPAISAGFDYDPLDKRAHTDGSLNAGVELRLVDEGGDAVAPGAPGEILARGAEQFSGYVDPAHQADAFDADGYFRTGDIGTLDAEGFLTIVDRKKDIIIRGGENISSLEIEDLLLRHPAIAQAAVIAVPDPRYGEKVAAFVELRCGGTVTLDEIGALFRSAGVARQKTPERLTVVDELPRTALGKVKKAELRALP